MSAAQKTTASARRNGRGMQKYWVYAGVGTRLARVRSTAIADASGRRSRESAHETQDATLTTKSRMNCRLITPSASPRPSSVFGAIVFWAHQSMRL